MAYPAKTDLDAVVEAARRLIERDGVEHLSLGLVAAEVGIKTPSLYRHVASKSELLRAVNENTLRGLFEAYELALASVDTGSAPEDKLMAIFRAHRTFAHANPVAYGQAFSAAEPGSRGDERALVRMVLPIQSIMADIAGEDASLNALRGALALVHGFVMLELNKQFQRGGDLTAAFEAAIAAYVAGWRSKAPGRKHQRVKPH